MYVGSISNLHVLVFICIFLSNATLLEGIAILAGVCFRVEGFCEVLQLYSLNELCKFSSAMAFRDHEISVTPAVPRLSEVIQARVWRLKFSSNAR